MSSVKTPSLDKEIVKAFEAGGVTEYLEYLQSGKRVIWVNFKAGVAKGLGLTIGMTVVLGLCIWILTRLVDLPVVGEYFGQVEKIITDYQESTNYTDELAQMNQLLKQISENTKN